MLKVTIDNREEPTRFEDLECGDVFTYSTEFSGSYWLKIVGEKFTDLQSGATYSPINLASCDLVYVGRITEITVQK